jgi:hypothetical protein
MTPGTLCFFRNTYEFYYLYKIEKSYTAIGSASPGDSAIVIAEKHHQMCQFVLVVTRNGLGWASIHSLRATF